MTPMQRKLARHALGLPNRRRTSYRNAYAAETISQTMQEPPMTPNDPEFWPPTMTRLAVLLAFAAGPAWAGEAQPAVSLAPHDITLLAVIVCTAATLAAEKRIMALRVFGVVWCVLWLTSAVFADAYDEPGGWSDLVCPPGIETAQIDALDVSPDAGVLLPPGLDPARFVTPAEPLVTPSGLTPPPQPAEPGTPKPVALPWAAGLLIGVLAALWLLSGVMAVREGWRMRG